MLGKGQDLGASVSGSACFFGADVDGLGVDQSLQLGNQIVHNQ